MMGADEIKFKGIRVDNGGWVYGDLVHYFFIKMGKRTDHVSIGVDLDFYDVIPETVCLFSGFKDKNGVEIYAGDKFQYRKHDGYLLPDFTGEILFMMGCFGYVATSENMGEAFRSFSEIDELKKDFLDHIEVIGNIYDKAQQKQALIDTMRGDEKLGLYDE